MRVPEHPRWCAGAAWGHKHASVMPAREVWGWGVHWGARTIDHSIGGRNLTATPVPWVHLRVRAAAVGILVGIVVVVVHVHVRLGGLRGRWHDLLLLLRLLLLLLLLHRRHHLLLLLHLLLAHHLLPHHHVPAGCLGVGRNLRLTDVGHLHLWAGTVGPVPLHPHPPTHPLTPHHGPLAHGGRHGGTVHLARQLPTHHIVRRIRPALVLVAGW